MGGVLPGAERTQDIALLFQVNRKQRAALRAIGIQTVSQAAKMDPIQLSGQDPRLTLKSLQAVQRQARSLQEGTVMIRAPFEMTPASCEIHFDIESYPATDTDYLYGCLRRDRDIDGKITQEERASFFAKRLGDERRMWLKFLTWLETLPTEYTVHHYSAYEEERLQVLARRYHTEDNLALQRFQQSLIDLNEVTKHHAVFPIYVYSLKNIGTLIGARWNGALNHGADSVTVYERWLAHKQPQDLEMLVAYNQEDVRATAVLLDWLTRFAKAEAVYTAPFPWTSQIS